jgi:hypothetical protein
MSGTMPSLALSQTNAASRVPFVGCESDGQLGPVAAPVGTEKTVQMDPIAAKKMAYYKAEETVGVLAPRGWNCLGLYGSDGSILLVAPQPLKSSDLFSPKWGGITGPGIQASVSEGETSGRFEVARVIARVFPKQRAFVQDVIDEKIEPAGQYPFGPYPKDKLVYKSDRTVTYHTPPNSKGLGTTSRLKPSNLPIDGVAILTEEFDLLFLSVRMPADMSGLASQIAHQFEEENAE